MFALAFLAAALAQPRMFLAPSARVQVQPGTVLVNPAMLSPMPAAPAQPFARAAEPTMVLEEAGVVVASVPQTATLIANASDFGGSTIPVIGLLLLAATIGLLAGPVDQD
jgi:hypothetical protein